MSNQTCAERIDEQFQQRAEQLDEIYTKMDSDKIEEQEEAYNELRELPLEITTYTVVKILLSTGGPADWIEVMINPEDNNSIIGMTYHFQDWFDHAEKKIHSDSYLWQYASETLDTL